jgi:uncharacterized membrane protein
MFRKWFLVAFCLAAALRCLHLGRESVWLDEAASIEIAHDPVRDVVLDAATDVHPPLYYLVLHGWMTVAGDSERNIRALSVLLSLATMVAVVAFGSRWLDDRAALVAAALVAVSPIQIAFAQEARMYALLTLTALVSTYLLLSVVRSGAPRAYAAYVLATAAMLYTHAYASFVLVGQGLWLLGALVAVPSRRGEWWRRGLLAFGLAALAYLPWLPVFLAQLRVVERGFWIPPSGTVGGAIEAQAGSFALALVLVPCALAAIVAAAMRRRVGLEGQTDWTRAAIALLATVVVAVIGVPFVLSRFTSPIFLPKYTVAASPPFLLIVGWAVSRVPSRWLQIAIVVGVFAMTVAPLRVYFGATHKDDWRRVVALIEHEARPGDLVVFSQAFGVSPFHYYARRSDLVELPFLDVRGGLTTRSLDTLADVVVAPYERVWLVAADPDEATRALRDRLSSQRQAIDVIGGGVEATLFVRTDTTRRTP